MTGSCLSILKILRFAGWQKFLLAAQIITVSFWNDHTDTLDDVGGGTVSRTEQSFDQGFIFCASIYMIFFL